MTYSVAETALDHLNADPNFSTLATLVTASSVAKALLSGPGPVTLFAPVNSAFSSGYMTGYKVKFLLDTKNIATLEKVLAYHVVAGTQMSSSLTNGETINTEEGSSVTVQFNTSQLRIDDNTCGSAVVLIKDTSVSNGVIHALDTVLVPSGVLPNNAVFVAGARGDILAYGYDCRTLGMNNISASRPQIKPVGIVTDSTLQRVWWTDDQNYPAKGKNSWIGNSPMQGGFIGLWTPNLVDPQGMSIDRTARKLYFCEHGGNTLKRGNYDGTGIETLITRPNDNTFLPVDVAVDESAKIIFLAVQDGGDSGNGTLLQLDYTGAVTKVVASQRINNGGLCLDSVSQQLFEVQGGHGGQINCFAYGSKPCFKNPAVSLLNYPSSCDVDSSYVPYGGPANLVFSQSNIPGGVYTTAVDASPSQQVNTVAFGITAPLGVALGTFNGQLP